MQSAFCRPFIVKTSGEIPCRNILSNATLPVSRRGRLGRCAAPARLARSSGRGEIRGRTCPGRHNTPGCPYIGVIMPAFQDVRATKDLTIPKSHGIITLGNKVPVAYFCNIFNKDSLGKKLHSMLLKQHLHFEQLIAACIAAHLVNFKSTFQQRGLLLMAGVLYTTQHQQCPHIVFVCQLFSFGTS